MFFILYSIIIVICTWRRYYRDFLTPFVDWIRVRLKDCHPSISSLREGARLTAALSLVVVKVVHRLITITHIHFGKEKNMLKPNTICQGFASSSLFCLPLFSNDASSCLYKEKLGSVIRLCIGLVYTCIYSIFRYKGLEKWVWGLIRAHSMPSSNVNSAPFSFLKLHIRYNASRPAAQKE